MNIINTTPHTVTFRNLDKTEFTVEPCGILINARIIEKHISIHPSGADLVRAYFISDYENSLALAELETANPDALIVGSIIAAQAFPGRVFGLTSAPGFERVPVDQKRMNPDKFTTF